MLPVAVYRWVGLEGRGLDHYRERYGPLEVLCFNYLYVGLPKLEALTYLEQDNVEHWPADKLEELISRAVLMQSLAEFEL